MCMFLAACGSELADHTPDYRYRLTVEVETPEGLRTGSSVIEVRQSMGRSAMSGFGKRIDRRVRGEAVAVDLLGGRTLYALLRSDDNIDWASYVMPMLAPKIEGEAWEDEFDNVLLIKGTVELPRTWPAHGKLSRGSAYPMLVTFADERDPKSIARVDPDDLSASFGVGVKLRRITVALTSDPVTTEIERRLEWLPNYHDKLLDGQRLNSIDAINRLANDLSRGDFTRESAP
ncbi:hypothetical protein ACXYN8_08195 [Altererythrobacter sp. CAU 1778]